MPWTSNILVLANETAGSPELAAALAARGVGSRASFQLVLPCAFGLRRADAERRLGFALERLQALGLDVKGRVGAPDPLIAAVEAWDPAAFDEVVVSTLPNEASRWLEIGLPRRIARRTGAPVQHVEATRDWLDEPPADVAATQRVASTGVR